jgi:hypothetical protein
LRPKTSRSACPLLFLSLALFLLLMMGSDLVSGFGLKDKQTRSPWKPFTGSDPVHGPDPVHRIIFAIRDADVVALFIRHSARMELEP